MDRNAGHWLAQQDSNNAAKRMSALRDTMMSRPCQGTVLSRL